MTETLNNKAFKNMLRDLESRFESGSIEPPDTATLQKLGDSANELAKKSKLYTRLLSPALFAGVALLAAYIIPPISGISPVVLILGLALLVGSSAVYNLLEIAFAPAIQMNKELVPLSSPEKCGLALRLANEFTDCEAYRQNVLKQNREFVELDLAYLQIIAERSRENQTVNQAQRNCKALYDITA